MTETTLPKNLDPVKALAQSTAQRMLDDSEGVRAVVIATVDGFDIASSIRGDLNPARIAALASSISAISQVVAEEAGLGRGKRVAIETDAGFAVVHSVYRPEAELVIIVIADSKAILGQVSYLTAAMARQLADL